MTRLALAAPIAALALALAGCSGEESATTGTATSGEPIAAIAAPAGATWADTITRSPEGGYVMGNPDAPIKIIEFASLTCSHCAEFSEAGFEPLRDDFINTGRVSLELRNYLRDPVDLTTAMLTRCGAEGSYFALTEAAFANQGAVLTRAQSMDQQIFALPAEQRYIAVADALGLIDFFSGLGVSRDQAEACLAQADEAETLARQAQVDGEKYNITGTPTFLINGNVEQARTWPAIETRLREMGAR